MKRWSISTKDNAGRPAEKPVEESGEAPPLEKPSTSGMERAWHVLKKDIHQPFSKCRKYRDDESESMDSHASSSTKYNIPNV